MRQDIQIASNEDYGLVVVKCVECGVSSSGFIYKSDLTGSEQIKYIEESVDFVVDTEIGGLKCPECVNKENKQYVRMV